MSGNIILRQSTTVNGSITSETCTIGSSGGPSLKVDGDDVLITCNVDGAFKEYKLSEIVEAILALDQRTTTIVEGPGDSSITIEAEED
jgi:hypothetical protein